MPADRDDDPRPGEHELDERYREPGEPEFDLGPDVPRAPDPADADVDPELSSRFWALVVVFNVALLATSIGALFALLGGEPVLGGQLFLGGVILFGYGLYRYRKVTRSLGDDPE